MAGFFDLEEHFAFYGAYHSNPINILIHMCFVWPIMFGHLMLFNYVPMPFLPNFGLFITLIYAFCYVGMDKKAGLLAALLCFACWYGATTFANHLGFDLAWKVVLISQLCCWTGQLVGHGVFEKRAPAFTDKFAQAFLLAPFFVLFEALTHFFGYEPYPGFRAKVKVKTDAEIKDWQERKQKKEWEEKKQAQAKSM